MVKEELEGIATISQLSSAIVVDSITQSHNGTLVEPTSGRKLVHLAANSKFMNGGYLLYDT